MLFDFSAEKQFYVGTIKRRDLDGVRRQTCCGGLHSFFTTSAWVPVVFNITLCLSVRVILGSKSFIR